MNLTRLILRETGISIVINMVLSILFFVAVFGQSAPVEVAALGPDFLPQSFMIALMSSLVPSLLQRKKARAAARPIVIRSLIFAVVATLIGGGAAFLICSGYGTATLDPMTALIVKALYGAVLAALVTPIALRTLFARQLEVSL